MFETSDSCRCWWSTIPNSRGWVQHGSLVEHSIAVSIFDSVCSFFWEREHSIYVAHANLNNIVFTDPLTNNHPMPTHQWMFQTGFHTSTVSCLNRSFFGNSIFNQVFVWYLNFFSFIDFFSNFFNTREFAKQKVRFRWFEFPFQKKGILMCCCTYFRIDLVFQFAQQQ